MSVDSNTNQSIYKDKRAENTITSISSREQVLLRNTYYQKLIPITIKVSMYELDILEELKKKLKENNRSAIIRDAIQLYYSLLEGVETTRLGQIVIQSPIVNIVKAESNAKAVSKSETSIDITNKIVIDMDSYNEIVQLLTEVKKLVNNWYRLGNIPLAATKTASEKLKKIEKLLKGAN